MQAAATEHSPFEGRTWASVEGTWRQLHGSFASRGVSVEWHDFSLADELPWSDSFHPDSLEICLNLEGDAEMRSRSRSLEVRGRAMAVYAHHSQLRASRSAGGAHRFLTIELSRDYLSTRLGGEPDGLHPGMRSFLTGGKRSAALLEAVPMSPADQSAVVAWTSPSVAAAGQPLWYEAKILDLLSRVAFPKADQPEMFCARQKRLGRERMERVVELLKARLHEPPTLEELGREVGCSPFYLSRTFSEHAGQTIPQFLRQLRMERAAELLREGRKNVTEVAFEVGYSSLGHFSKSFCEVIGVCPSLYPAAAALTKRPRPREEIARQR
jgi:AraC-like DNA-binding protein